jgi:hypothetical protein
LIFRGWGDETTGYFIPNNKEEILYDNFGNKIEESVYGWSEVTNSYYYHSKLNWTFHNNGNTKEYIDLRYSFDGTSSTNYPFVKHEYKYNIDENLTHYIYYVDVGNSLSLEPQTKDEYIYDDYGRLTGIFKYYHGDYYFLYGKNEYSYDDDSNLITRIEYDVTSYTDGTSDSEPISKNEITIDMNGNQTLPVGYTYNNIESGFVLSGKMTLDIEYSWNTESQSFVPIHKSEYNYDENGNRTLTEIYDWNTESQSFIPSSKYEYTYDENGNKILENRYGWNTESQYFLLNNKKEYNYDHNGNVTLYIKHDWDSESQSLVPKVKIERTYIGDEERWSMNTGYTWNIESQSFIIDYKRGREYNSNGDYTLLVDLSRDENNDYDVNYYIEYVYDDENKLFQGFNYDWDSISKSFIVVEKINYENLEKFDSYWWYGESEKLDSDIGVFKPNRKWEISVEFEDENNLTVLRKYFDYDTDFNRWEEPDDYFMYYTKTPSLSTNSIETNSFLNLS